MTDASYNVHLTAEAVTDVFKDCFFTEDEIQGSSPPDDAVIVEGIMITVGFHPKRLELHTDDIMAFLMELPVMFRENEGGGWSFLNACLDRHGDQWTSYHEVMEQLFLLGIAIGHVQELLPRSLWSILPGGVPYYVITSDRRDEKSDV